MPFNFRKDFDKKYLDEINFICLAMTDNYINNHFNDIVFHSEDVEKRLYNQCKIEDIKNENKKVIYGFKETLINAILEEFILIKLQNQVFPMEMAD